MPSLMCFEGLPRGPAACLTPSPGSLLSALHGDSPALRSLPLGVPRTHFSELSPPPPPWTPLQTSAEVACSLAPSPLCPTPELHQPGCPPGLSTRVSKPEVLAACPAVLPPSTRNARSTCPADRDVGRDPPPLPCPRLAVRDSGRLSPSGVWCWPHTQFCFLNGEVGDLFKTEAPSPARRLPATPSSATVKITS